MGDYSNGGLLKDNCLNVGFKLVPLLPETMNAQRIDNRGNKYLIVV